MIKNKLYFLVHCGFAALASLFAFSCKSEVTSPGRGAVISEFGTYPFENGSLYVSEDPKEKGILYFSCHDKRGKEIASSEALKSARGGGASVYQRWSLFLYKDAIWLNSSDIGLYYWKINRSRSGYAAKLTAYTRAKIPAEVFLTLPTSVQKKLEASEINNRAATSPSETSP